MNRLQKMARAMLTLALAATCAAQAYYSPTNSTPSASTSFGIWEVNPNQKLSDVAPLSSAAFEKNPVGFDLSSVPLTLLIWTSPVASPEIFFT